MLIDNERIKEQMARYHSDDPAVRDRATEEIIHDYGGFITHLIQRHFSGYISKYFEDMFSVGNIGLLEALKRYNPDKSMPTTFFASYIVHSIYEFVSEFIGQTSRHYAAKIVKINKAKAELKAEGIDNPTIIDLAMKTGLKPDIVMKSLNIQNSTQMLSFDDEEFVFSNMTDDPNLQPEALYIKKEGQQIIKNAIEALPDKMREVLMRKRGLCGYKEQTNEQISKAVGVPPGGVRHLYNKALDQLRESEIFDFFSSQYRSAPRFVKEEVALVPEESAGRMIEALLEYDDT
jgi:RNA polymerase sigma factor for flagellar operon FliA